MEVGDDQQVEIGIGTLIGRQHGFNVRMPAICPAVIHEVKVIDPSAAEQPLPDGMKVK